MVGGRPKARGEPTIKIVMRCPQREKTRIAVVAKNEGNTLLFFCEQIDIEVRAIEEWDFGLSYVTAHVSVLFKGANTEGNEYILILEKSVYEKEHGDNPDPVIPVVPVKSAMTPLTGRGEGQSEPRVGGIRVMRRVKSRVPLLRKGVVEEHIALTNLTIKKREAFSRGKKAWAAIIDFDGAMDEYFSFATGRKAEQAANDKFKETGIKGRLA